MERKEFHVDFIRQQDPRRRTLRRAAYSAAGLGGMLAITLLLSNLKPAAPAVERDSVWVDTVKRGPMLRQVRGLGTLVPEEVRWIPAATEGRVERFSKKFGLQTSETRKTAEKAAKAAQAATKAAAAKKAKAAKAAKAAAKPPKKEKTEPATA